ncbi:MAG: hypothetical protein ACRDT6_21045 [Micromonosporaceae bacterium]
MIKSCWERIGEIDGLDPYRVAVGDISMLSGTTYPDPEEYAFKVDGDLAGLKKAEAALHPDTTTYAKIRGALSRAKDNHELDLHWVGDASEQFTDSFLVKLDQALEKLDETRNEQRAIVGKMRAGMEESHDNIVSEVESMVRQVVASYVAAVVGVGVASVAGGPAGGAAALAAAVAGLVGLLSIHHKALKRECAAFNKTLADNKGGLAELVEISLPELSNKVDRSNWAMNSGD